ncbi:MAG TPA: DNA-directed RNA polymerase subunit epsilon [Sporolactobacillaceae bacterium]|nr:DNA-directed RNA polymerase subunit epsilon [Sporolactobacillaceae bacterium]
MIYKVLYQKSKVEVPVRENTHTMFVEAESEREVRKKLAGREINIEFIHLIEGPYLEYEMQTENFEVEKL